MSPPTGESRAALVARLKEAAARGDLAEADAIAGHLCTSFGREEPLGFIYFAQRDLQARKLDAVVEQLRPLAERFPAEPAIPYLIAQAYAGMYRHGQAEPFLRQAAALAPHDSGIQFLLGRNLYKAGRNAEAIPYLRTAAAAMTEDAGVAGMLGKALAAVGDLAAAQAWLRKASALAPGNSEIAAELADVAASEPQAPHRPRFARWPESVGDFSDLDAAMRNHVICGYDTNGFQLQSGMTVVTQGSCFAGNLARSFARYPLNVQHIPFGEEHNSTYANVAVAEWLRDGVTNDATRIVAETMGEQTRSQYCDALAKASLYVYTLGVAPVFFDRKTGAFQLARNTAAANVRLLRTCDFRTTTVEENVANLRKIIAIVRDLNPACTVVLSLSPVPMNSTSELPSVIVADCLSKSTLRVAAHQLTQRPQDRIFYWPSFEVVRWLSGHHGRVYGNDDGSSHHIDFKVIDIIIDNFMKVFAAGMKPKGFTPV